MPSILSTKSGILPVVDINNGLFVTSSESINLGVLSSSLPSIPEHIIHETPSNLTNSLKTMSFVIGFLISPAKVLSIITIPKTPQKIDWFFSQYFC
jgi:hypothetical protein